MTKKPPQELELNNIVKVVATAKIRNATVAFITLELCWELRAADY